jgi:hypothetical protein
MMELPIVWRVATIPSFPQQLTKYFIMYPLYSRQVSALILGHHQVNLQNIKKNNCCEEEAIISGLTQILFTGIPNEVTIFLTSECN